MALRMIYDKAMGFAAKQYQTVLGNQLAQYGEYWCDGVEGGGSDGFWNFRQYESFRPRVGRGKARGESSLVVGWAGHNAQFSFTNEFF